MAENGSMSGYTRVSKADGRQVHDLQFDALIAAGVDPKRIYQDSISGAGDCRRGLTARSMGRRFKNDTERLESCSSSTLG